MSTKVKHAADYEEIERAAVRAEALAAAEARVVAATILEYWLEEDDDASDDTISDQHEVVREAVAALLAERERAGEGK